LPEVVRRIRQQIYEPLCKEIREQYLVAEAQQRLDELNDRTYLWEKLLPKVCFATNTLNRNAK